MTPALEIGHDPRAIARALETAPPNGILQLAPARYELRAPLVLRRGVRIVGKPGTVLDGCDQHRIVELRGGDEVYAFQGIRFERGRAEDGGALFSANRSTVELLDCAFSFNHVSARGAAVSLRHTRAIARGCVFQGNVGEATAAGGAIYLGMGAALEIESSTFRANEADAGGAIFLADTGALTLKECAFFGNRARRARGGNALFVFGAKSSGPSAHLSRTQFDEKGALGHDPSKAATVFVTSCVLEQPLGSGPFVDAGGNRAPAKLSPG